MSLEDMEGIVDMAARDTHMICDKIKNVAENDRARLMTDLFSFYSLERLFKKTLPYLPKLEEQIKSLREVIYSLSNFYEKYDNVEILKKLSDCYTHLLANQDILLARKLITWDKIGEYIREKNKIDEGIEKGEYVKLKKERFIEIQEPDSEWMEA
jgi:hypothetical protein